MASVITAGGDHLGYSDFPGGDEFDYNLEDGGSTHPWRRKATWRHFRDIDDVEKDMENAIKARDRDALERYTHQKQDWFSHRKGLGFPNKGEWKKARKAHIKQGHAPDNTNLSGPQGMWDEASEWMQEWLDKWEENSDKGQAQKTVTGNLR